MGAMLYGEPRLTLDIDLAVALENPDSLQTVYPAPHYYCPPQEVLRLENKRECRGHFNIIHVPSGLKADFYPSQRDPFFEWAWSHRRIIIHGGKEVCYAPAEYIVVWKVAYFYEGGSEKHVRDIRRMLELSLSDIDAPLLEAELNRRGLLQIYHGMIQKTP